MKIIEFIFASFWHFIGFIIILYALLNFIIILSNRILRHRNIRKLGYPPVHCDADGEFFCEDCKNDDCDDGLKSFKITRKD